MLVNYITVRYKRNERWASSPMIMTMRRERDLNPLIIGVTLGRVTSASSRA